MNYTLPKEVEVNGVTHPIRSDYRAVLDIITALNDFELSNSEKAFVMLDIFYEDFDHMPEEDYQAAVKACCDFIDYNAPDKTNAKKVIDWEQDFNYIIAPINRVAGHDIRADEYMHWWTFLSYYYEIGDCLLAQIVRVRSALKKGKKLDDTDREWYRENHDLVDFKTHYSEAEEELMRLWGG